MRRRNEHAFWSKKYSLPTTGKYQEHLPEQYFVPGSILVFTPEGALPGALGSCLIEVKAHSSNGMMRYFVEAVILNAHNLEVIGQTCCFNKRCLSLPPTEYPQAAMKLNTLPPI